MRGPLTYSEALYIKHRIKLLVGRVFERVFVDITNDYMRHGPDFFVLHVRILDEGHREWAVSQAISIRYFREIRNGEDFLRDVARRAVIDFVNNKMRDSWQTA